MASTGMRCPVWAPLKTHENGQEPSYNAGRVLAEAVSSEITIRRSSAVNYGDNREVDADNSIVGIDIALTVTDVKAEDKAAVLGYHKNGTGYDLIADATPYGGLGYVEETRHNGVVSFVAWWFYKVQLGINSMSLKTRENETTFNNPTMNGKAMGLEVQQDGKIAFFHNEPCENEEQAIAWIKNKAGITGTTSGG